MVSKDQVIKGIMPALDILRSLHHNLQDHVCPYYGGIKADHAADCLLKLLKLAQEVENEDKPR